MMTLDRFVSSLIDGWPSISAFAAEIGCSYEAARQMRRRGSIPAGYWLRVIECANARGIEGVTLERLAELAAQAKEVA